MPQGSDAFGNPTTREIPASGNASQSRTRSTGQMAPGSGCPRPLISLQLRPPRRCRPCWFDEDVRVTFQCDRPTVRSATMVAWFPIPEPVVFRASVDLHVAPRSPGSRVGQTGGPCKPWSTSWMVAGCSWRLNPYQPPDPLSPGSACWARSKSAKRMRERDRLRIAPRGDATSPCG